MRKTVLKLALAAFVASMGADLQPAQAQGLFENLFGPRKMRVKKYSRKADQQFGAERRTGRFGKNRIRILRGGDQYDDTLASLSSSTRKVRKKASNPARDYSDPEPIPGLGWGNPVYVPPKLVPLADPALGKLATGTAKNPQILQTLANLKSGVRVEMPLRASILDLYKANGYAPLWTEGGKVSDRAMKLLQLAAAVAEDGLDPQDYLPAPLASFNDVEGQLAGDPAALASFDVAMTAASVKLAQHLSGGRFEANRLSLYNDLPSQRVSPETALRVLAYSPFPESYLKSLAPTHPAYGLMKAELARLMEGGTAPETSVIPEGDTIKQGGADPRILKVRDRLQALGFVSDEGADIDAEDAMKLDANLAKALKAYQRSVKLKASGRLDNATVKKLNGNTRETDMARLIYNLERVRWLPRDMGERHVFVNQPAFEVRVMDKGSEIWRSNVVIGRQTTQTASFYDEMETVVFNPTWGIPQSILVNEYLGKLRRDPGYLDRIGYKVVNQKGKVVSSRSINWQGYSQSSPVGVIQPSGSDNALGELKFLFPNTHSIYMHDTPAKELFGEPVRAFSHGCVRVQDPREFARIVLGWDPVKVAAMAESPASETVKLDKKLPVYLAYFTAWPDASGKIQYFNDIYERDATMARAMANRQQPSQAAAISGEISQN